MSLTVIFVVRGKPYSLNEIRFLSLNIILNLDVGSLLSFRKI